MDRPDVEEQRLERASELCHSSEFLSEIRMDLTGPIFVWYTVVSSFSFTKKKLFQNLYLLIIQKILLVPGFS